MIDFDYYVYNEANNIYFDLLVVDVNESAAYEPLEDKILVGTSYEDEDFPILGARLWEGTHFSLSFSEYPESGDIYSIRYNSPFLETDSLFIHTNAPDSVNIDMHNEEMSLIKVVPNPYVGTNLMEEAFSNPNQSQERKIMFTHLPAQCKISIFTVSGILVDEIEVNNDLDDGMAYWDLLSNEGLEVAAGMYIYYVQSQINDQYKLGKFAIIK